MNNYWKEIPGYEGLYEASTQGEIRHIYHKRKDREDFILFQTITHHGYKRTVLQKNNTIKNYFVHGIIALTFIGPKPNGFQVNHINKDRSDNRISNLEYVSPQKNTQHSRFGKKRGVRTVHDNLFSVYLWVKGKSKYIGSSPIKEVAYDMYKEEYKKVYGFYPW